MKINLKEVSVFLSAILLAGSYAVAQNPYRWTDELELLKEWINCRSIALALMWSSSRVTTVPEAMMMVLRVLILSFVRKVISW